MISATTLNPLAAPAASSAANTSSATSSTSSANPQAGSQDYFLKLLVAQMQNQDPLNPMDNAQVTSQMAQINTVQGIAGVATKLDSLLASFSAAQPVQATSLIGHTVLAPGATLSLAGGSATGGIDLAGAADHVKVTVLDGSNQVVQTIDLGAEAAGTLRFDWDGATDSGAKSADGSYTFKVQASLGGKTVSATALARATVTGVDPNAAGTQLTLGSLGTFALAQIKQIS